MSDRYEQLVATEDNCPTSLKHVSFVQPRNGIQSAITWGTQKGRESIKDDYLGRFTLPLRAASAHTSYAEQAIRILHRVECMEFKNLIIKFFIWARTPLLNTDQMLKYVWTATANVSRQMLCRMSSSIFKRWDACPESRKRHFEIFQWIRWTAESAGFASDYAPTHIPISEKRLVGSSVTATHLLDLLSILYD